MIASILNSVKKYLGLDASIGVFDPQIIDAINSAFMSLHQLGIGPTTVYSITSSTEEWTDFLASPDLETYSSIRPYVNITVKMLFDPPTSGILVGAYERQKSELEHRLNTQLIDQTTVQEER